VAAQHKRSLEQFDFDSVLCPYNYITAQNSKYSEDFETLLRLCQERNVAVQTIKSIARQPWGLTQAHTANTWYEPFSEQGDIDLAVQWVLSRDQVFLNTAGDIHLLPKVLEAAQRFDQRQSQDELGAKLAEKEMAPLFV
jgi:hypothetical protein